MTIIIRKLIFSLFVVSLYASTIFAMEPEQEHEYKTGLGAVKAYTDYLERAVILHDRPNTLLYAQTLSELIMTGNVTKSAAPTYQGENLPTIKATNYGFRNREAKGDEIAVLHRALDALATVQRWLIDTMPVVDSFSRLMLIKSPEGQKSSPFYAHRMAAYHHFLDRLKSSNPTNLERFFNATDTNKVPTGYEYKDSTYKGVVHVPKPVYIRQYKGDTLKTLYPWIKTIDIPKGVRGLDNVIGINVEEDKEHTAANIADQVEQAEAWEEFKSLVRNISEADKNKLLITPLKALFAFEKGDIKCYVWRKEELLTENTILYGALFESAVHALSIEDKTVFRQQFINNHNFGLLSPNQRELVLQMLDGQRLGASRFAFDR